MSLFSSSRWPLALFAFLTSIILTYASPVSATVLDNEVAHLEKRIIHIGRVSINVLYIYEATPFILYTSRALTIIPVSL